MKSASQDGQPGEAPTAVPEEATAVTIAILNELQARYPGGRAYVATVCRALGLAIEDAQQAIRLGVDRGWLIPDGDPATVICLGPFAPGKAG